MNITNVRGTMMRTGLRLVGLGLLLMISGALVSCGPDTSAPTLVRRDASLTTPPGAPPTPLQGAARVAFTDTECLKCHTDQAKLVTLAKPLPVVESESEGPG
jgi:hypothetical protein